MVSDSRASFTELINLATTDLSVSPVPTQVVKLGQPRIRQPRLVSILDILVLRGWAMLPAMRNDLQSANTSQDGDGTSESDGDRVMRGHSGPPIANFMDTTEKE